MASATEYDSVEAPLPQEPTFFLALIAGGLAGTTVDVALFPIDTIKTRLQAPGGFLKAGGFRGIYNGLGAAAAGSAPGAALFFSTYESMKPILASATAASDNNNNNNNNNTFEYYYSSPTTTHMLAASVGEAAACLVRVPTEVIKAKMQTNQTLTLMSTIRAVWQEGGSWLSPITGGLYRGYGITLFREIPFAMIQFPLYERLKVLWSERQGGIPATPVQAAACGSLSGGIAAGLTTPLDVIKTRLMLGVDQHGRTYRGVMDVVQRTWQQTGGGRVFWSGFQPRVMWISIGGFVFFGAYESYRSILGPVLL